MEQLLEPGTLTDVVVLASFVAAFIVYGTWRGTDGLLSILLALPVTAFLYSIFPYHERVETLFASSPSGVAPLGVFVVLLLGVLWVFHRTFGSAHGGSGALHIIATAVGLTALLVTLSYVLVPAIDVYTFSPAIETLFAAPVAVFWIVVALLIVILFT